MIVIIDNYDSFTYNLLQYLAHMGPEVRVFRNDAIGLEALEDLQPRGIVISPGPGRPETAGISIPLVRRFSGRIPLLGVCLGHQAIAEAFGGRVVHARKLMHGKTSLVTPREGFLFRGIRKPFQAMRYHSLAVSRETLPPVLEVTAEDEDGEIMGIRHREDPTEGIQFHPESIMTPVGKRLLRNFLRRVEDGDGKVQEAAVEKTNF